MKQFRLALALALAHGARTGTTMDILVEGGAGLDVHKDTVVACMRTPGAAEKCKSKVRTFATMAVHLLLALQDGRRAVGVSPAGTEPTGALAARVLRTRRCHGVLPVECPPYAQRLRTPD